MDLTLVICTYNRSQSLKVTLESIKGQMPESSIWEIIVVDNANDPSTQRVISDLATELPVSCVVEETPGQNSARNAVLPHIKGELVAFTDDDVIAGENWLSELVHAAKKYPDYDVFGGKIIPQWPNGVEPWQANAWFSNFVYADQDLGDQIIDYGEGCFPSSPNMMIRRSIFDKGIKFNAKIGPIGSKRISGSESEFFSRVMKSHKGKYIPSARIFHRITPNMMVRSYLRKRSYAMGLGMSVWASAPSNEKSLPTLLGVPRYRIGRLITSLLKAVGCQILLKKERSIEHECMAAMDFGYCQGLWKGLKNKI